MEANFASIFHPIFNLKAAVTLTGTSQYKF